MVSSCSIENQTEHKDGCLKGTSGIIFLPDYDYELNKAYNNYHCVLCNGLSMKDASCYPPFSYFFEQKSFEIVMQFKTPTSNQKKNEGHEILLDLSTKQGLRPTSENLRGTQQRFQFFKSKQVSPEILDASFGWSNETGDNAPI